MTDQRPLEAMIDQPRIAVRAVEPEAAGAAERERRIAAAIEKQQRLLPALERRLHGAGKTRRDEAPARRAFALEIDRLDRRLALSTEALRQRKAAIAPAPRVHLGFDRWRRGRKNDRNAGNVRAHHRHV